MSKLISANSKLELKTPARVLAKWQPLAEDKNEPDNTISILDIIDADWGVGAKRINAALRAIGAENPVTVKINSAGGSLSEGVAIYNLLKEHKGAVTVKVISLAASAASIIAMAGDKIEMMQGASLMVHNAWSFAMGNKYDMEEAAKVLDHFDKQMASIYKTRFNGEAEALTELLDAESYLTGAEAVALGLADVATDEAPASEPNAHLAALKTVEYALQANGLSRSERREILKTLNQETPKPSAREKPAKPSASFTETAALAENLTSIFE